MCRLTTAYRQARRLSAEVRSSHPLGGTFVSSRSIQGRLAAESRYRPDDDHTDLKRSLKAAQLEEHIARTVDAWPPLTDEQRDKLATLLRGGQVV